MTSKENYLYYVLFVFVFYAGLCWFLNPNGWIADDSYFYLVIARNVAQLGEQTFSRIMPTNGVHPLWIWILSAAFSLANIFETSWLATPHLATLLSLLFLAIAVYFHMQLNIALYFQKYSIFIVVIFSTVFGTLGSEAHVSYASICLLSYILIISLRSNTTVSFGLLGFCALIAFFARLDNVFFCLAILVVVWCKNFRHSKFNAFLPAAIFASGTFLYIGSNYVWFGGLMPVSGWMKSSFPDVYPKGIFVAGSGGNPLFMGVSILWGWLPMIGMSVGLPFVKGEGKALFLSLWSGVILKNIYIILFTRSHTGWYWYSILDVFAASMFVSFFVTRMHLEKLFRNVALSAVMVSMLVLAYRIFWGGEWATHGAAGQSMELVKEKTNSGDTILVSDWPGYVAYYLADRNIIAADMLTSNRRWYSEMRQYENAFDFIKLKTCASGYPLSYVLWNGNSWLVFDNKTGELIYNDPRKYPIAYPIGSIELEGYLVGVSGKVRLWRIPY